MFEDLGDKKRVQRRLVVPDFGIKPIAFETQRCLGQFKTLISTDLNRCSQRNATLNKRESTQQNRQNNGRSPDQAAPIARARRAQRPGLNLATVSPRLVWGCRHQLDCAGEKVKTKSGEGNALKLSRRQASSASQAVLPITLNSTFINATNRRVRARGLQRP